MKRNIHYKMAKFIMISLVILGLLSKFLASEDPIKTTCNGQNFFPLLHNVGVDLGLKRPYDLNLENFNTCQNSVYTLVPFSASTVLPGEKTYLPPLSTTNSSGRDWIHWLGTDAIGRDVLSGWIHGARKAIFIASIATIISLLIGLLLGILAGYYGNSAYRLPRFALLIICLSLIVLSFYAIYGHLSFCLGMIVMLLVLMFFHWSSLMNTSDNGFFTKKVSIPFDDLIMRCVEIFKTVPALFLLFGLLAVLPSQGYLTVAIIIGLLRWPQIARLVRGEILKLKNQNFVENARVLGLSRWQILTRHLLRNALDPIIIAVAFSFASAVLLESSISFLGIGLGPEELTWGQMLSQARFNFSAWWLAVFPGFGIFLLVYSANIIGNHWKQSLKKSN